MSEQQPVTESKEVLGIKITHISGRKSNGGNIIPDVIRFGDGVELDKVYRIVEEMGLGNICNAVIVFDNGKISNIIKSIDVWNKPMKNGKENVLDEVSKKRLDYLKKMEQAIEAKDMTLIGVYSEMLKQLDQIKVNSSVDDPGKLKDSDSRKVDSSVSKWTSNASDEDSNSPF